jgi:hypothetical protein
MPGALAVLPAVDAPAVPVDAPFAFPAVVWLELEQPAAASAATTKQIRLFLNMRVPPPLNSASPGN